MPFHTEKGSVALEFDVMKAGEGASKQIFRAGRAGGWREHFSGEDEARLKSVLAERLPTTAESLVGLDAWRADMP